MRVFTDAEKQQLQAKIKDEQERQRVLKEIAQIEKEKEAKRSRGIISTAFSYKYGFLVFILLLIVLDIHLLLPLRHYDPHSFLALVVTLMLLFNHIAYQFTKRGWLSRVMKTIAWIWIVFGFAYLFWVLKTGLA